MYKETQFSKELKVVFICSRLDLPGGIERAIINTANLLQEKNFKVTLLILDQTIRTFYSINKDVILIKKNLHFGITKEGNIFNRKAIFFKHWFLLYNQLQKLKPNVIIGTEYHLSIMAKLSIFKKQTKVLAWEHHHFNHLEKNKFWNFLWKYSYIKLDRVICLNTEEEEMFRNNGCKTTVIPNFLPRLFHDKISLRKKTLLTVGWLNYTKGIDRIIKIARVIFNKHPDWQWIVIGKGNEKEQLLHQISIAGLDKHIRVIDPTKNDLSEDYKNASIYVMTSRFECFPMVLLEAMNYGTPCIAFDCPTGPRHIIDNNKNGLLIENDNIEAMSNAIEELIEKQDKRLELGKNASTYIESFSRDKIYLLWESLFETVCSK